MSPKAIETALSSLAQGIVGWANEFEDLDDVISAQTNAEMHRLDEFTRLRDACGPNGHILVGSTLTLVRRATNESICFGVGVSSAPPFETSELLSWQCGFWCNTAGDGANYTSPVYAMPADAGDAILRERLRPAAEDTIQCFISESGVKHQAFVSYVREDGVVVDQLCADLGRQGVATWKDRNDLVPGARWKDAIRDAIQGGSGFLACFSKAYESRPRTYMNEELSLAVEELRLRPRDRTWFFPVLLDDVESPPIPIGPGETLRDLHAVTLGSDWHLGVGRLARAIRSAS